MLSYGFYERNQTGSHINYKKDGVKDLITIPKHDKEVKLYSVKKSNENFKINTGRIRKEAKRILAVDFRKLFGIFSIGRDVTMKILKMSRDEFLKELKK